MKTTEALERAQLSAKKERQLRRLRKQQQQIATLPESGEPCSQQHQILQHDPELTFAVILNVANQNQVGYKSKILTAGIVPAKQELPPQPTLHRTELGKALTALEGHEVRLP